VEELNGMNYRVVGCAGDVTPLNRFLRQLARERETRKVKKFEDLMLATPTFAGERELEMDHDGPRLKEISNPSPRIMKCKRDYQERLIKENRKQFDDPLDNKRDRSFIDYNVPDFKRMCLNPKVSSTVSNFADLDVRDNGNRKRNSDGYESTDNNYEKRMKNE